MHSMTPSLDANSRTILRDLAARYLEICSSARNINARELWRKHNSLDPGRPLVICSAFFTSTIEDEIKPLLPPPAVPALYRDLEYWLQSRIWASAIGDDNVYEPWYYMPADLRPTPPGYWGIPLREERNVSSHGVRYFPVISSVEDLGRLEATPHEVIHEETVEIRRVRDAIGDILPVHSARNTAYPMWFGTDLSMAAGAMVGLEQLMLMMYDNPALLHRLMEFMRDGVLNNIRQGEQAGSWSTADSNNYSLPRYVNNLPDPEPETYGAKLSDLWFFTHAQEFESTSPAQFEEYLLQYQMPIMECFGLVNYGCCETLNNKIDLLKTVSNLRRIAMGPLSNLREGCEQIGRDYVVSWRPNPAMVSVGFDAVEVRRIIRQGLADSRGCNVEIMLKEILTIGGDASRLFKWSEVAVQEAEGA